MTAPQAADRWRKSSRSSTASACVEVGNTLTALRDSKNPGPVLSVALAGMLAAVKAGHFDR